MNERMSLIAHGPEAEAEAQAKPMEEPRPKARPIAFIGVDPGNRLARSFMSADTSV